MMKKLLIAILIAFCFSNFAFGLEEIFDRENLSIKAGPTIAGEKLSLAWVEALVYPKYVRDDRVISLGVRTTSKVNNVFARFDFDTSLVALKSHDGLSWTSAYKLPEEISLGVHVVRFEIEGKKGTIQRTVEFFVEKSETSVASENDMDLKTSWPLTVLTTCTVFVDEEPRLLYPGQVLKGVAKVYWYRVLFEDGKEGWISSSKVEDPAKKFFLSGTQFYQQKKYATAAEYFRNAIAVDQSFSKAYFWLAKCYFSQKNLDLALKMIKKALQLDDRDLESRAFSQVLAQSLFRAANKKFQEGRYHEAISGFQKVLDLKPESAAAWLKLGDSFAKLGMESEAKLAWREGLKENHDDKILRARLEGSGQIVASASPKKESKVSSLVADDLLKILREEKTNRGTKIEAALKSVISLTKSLGTMVVEKGWQIRQQGGKALVSYVCEQGGGALETFEWLVDVDTRQVLPHNENARLLMSRW